MFPPPSSSTFQSRGGSVQMVAIVLRRIVGATFIVSALAACHTPRFTPEQLEAELKREFPTAPNIRQIEDFLETRKISHSQDFSNSDSLVRASIRDVKRDLISSFDILMEFRFDGDGRLVSHKIRWSDVSP